MPPINTLNTSSFATHQADVHSSSSLKMQDAASFIGSDLKPWSLMTFGEKIHFIFSIFTGNLWHPSITDTERSETAQALSALREETPNPDETQRFSAHFQDGSSVTLSYLRDGHDTTLKISSQNTPSGQPTEQIFEGLQADKIITRLPVTIGATQADATSGLLKYASWNTPCKVRGMDCHTTLIHHIPHGMETLSMAKLAMNMPTLEIDLPPQEKAVQIFSSVMVDVHRMAPLEQTHLSFCGEEMPHDFLLELTTALEHQQNNAADKQLNAARVQQAFHQACDHCPPGTRQIETRLRQDPSAQAALLASMAQGLLIGGADEAVLAYRGALSTQDIMDTATMQRDRKPLGTLINHHGQQVAIEDIRKFDVRASSDGGYHITVNQAKPFSGEQIYIATARGEVHIPQDITFDTLNTDTSVRESFISSCAILACADHE